MRLWRPFETRWSVPTPLAFATASVIAAVTVVAAGCWGPAADLRTSRLLVDPQIAELSSAELVQDFSGWESTIHLGPGWHRFINPEGVANLRAWSTRSSRVYFRRPVAGTFELVLRCQSYGYPGAPDQYVALHLNGRRTGRLLLTPRMKEFRAPLPADSLNPHVNRLDFHFDWAAKPAEVAGKANDIRRLAALFELVAVVPMGEPLDHGRARSDPQIQGSSATLGPGGGLSIPIPSGAISVSAAEPLVELIENGQLNVEVIHRSGTSTELFADGPSPSVRYETAIHTAPGDELRLRRPRAPSASRRSLAVDLGSLAFETGIPNERGDELTPSVFIYLIDTLRRDALGLYGGHSEASPCIDSFAAEAVVFDDAWSGSAWTLPAVASLFTGVHPSAHGIKFFGQKLTDSAHSPLAEILGKAGFHTVGISQTPVISESAGMHRGFDAFYEQGILGSPTPSSEMRWFFWNHFRGTPPDTPLFFYFHSMDPHAPYEPLGHDLRFTSGLEMRLPRGYYKPLRFMRDGLGTDQENRRYLRALYSGEVAFADRQFGALVDLLRAVDLYDDSLVILVSDHGEEFSEHGGYDHGRTMYNEMVQVPLIIKLPRGRHAGTRVAQRVSTVSVMPTVLHAVGIDPLSPGSLLGLTEPIAEKSTDEGTFAEVVTRSSGDRHGVDYRSAAVGDIKCILSLGGADQFGRPEPEVIAFDLATDPEERVPLELGRDGVRQCIEVLHRLHGRVLAAGARPIEEGALDESRLEQLRALGYVE